MEGMIQPKGGSGFRRGPVTVRFMGPNDIYNDQGKYQKNNLVISWDFDAEAGMKPADSLELCHPIYAQNLMVSPTITFCCWDSFGDTQPATASCTTDDTAEIIRYPQPALQIYHFSMKTTNVEQTWSTPPLTNINGQFC